jgi:hypothetical protein
MQAGSLRYRNELFRSRVKCEGEPKTAPPLISSEFVQIFVTAESQISGFPGLPVLVILLKYLEVRAQGG